MIGSDWQKDEIHGFDWQKRYLVYERRSTKKLTVDHPFDDWLSLGKRAFYHQSKTICHLKATTLHFTKTQVQFTSCKFALKLDVWVEDSGTRSQFALRRTHLRHSPSLGVVKRVSEMNSKVYDIHPDFATVVSTRFYIRKNQITKRRMLTVAASNNVFHTMSHEQKTI